MQEELARMAQEIRDLKTAQTTPGTSTLYMAQGLLPAGTYTGVYTWIIHYADAGSTDAPVTAFNHGSNWCLWPYNASTNTQRVELYANDLTTFDDIFNVYSTRPIIAIDGFNKTNDIDEYNPPSDEWLQVRTFNLANMGTTPGWCLMNCRLGFGINTGTYASARADMNAQRANGTLHDAGQNPPAYIQVPVYIDTGVADGHVVVWDRGTVYSDGVLIQNGLAYYGMGNIWGWGELCDGARVVRRA